MTECPEKFPLSWLNGMIDYDERFAAEALAIRLRIESYQPSHQRQTHTAASSATGLVNHWLMQRDLNGYERGRLVDNFGDLTVIPFDGCYTKGIASRESSIFIMRDELTALMRSEGMTIPPYLRHDHETSDLTDVQPLARFESIQAANDKAAIKPESKPQQRKRIQPSGGDSLTPMIWEICYDLADQQRKVTARPVMAELKQRAEKKIHPLVECTLGGVKYEYEKGLENEIDSEKLRKRIDVWKMETGD